jgi:hypothetical protein
MPAPLLFFFRFSLRERVKRPDVKQGLLPHRFRYRENVHLSLLFCRSSGTPGDDVNIGLQSLKVIFVAQTDNIEDNFLCSLNHLFRCGPLFWFMGGDYDVRPEIKFVEQERITEGFLYSVGSL